MNKNKPHSRFAAEVESHRTAESETGVHMIEFEVSGTKLTKQVHSKRHAVVCEKNSNHGFTLIEVLLALAVIAIALTALLKATAQDVGYTERIKENSISHWVAMQGVKMIQLGLLTVPANQEITQVTSMLGERWYWRVKLSPTMINSMQQINIKVSKNQNGPFRDTLIAYRRVT